MKNLSKTSRAWRWLLAIALLSWAFAGGPVWAYIGLYPLLTGSFGYTPFKLRYELKKGNLN